MIVDGGDGIAVSVQLLLMLLLDCRLHVLLGAMGLTCRVLWRPPWSGRRDHAVGWSLRLRWRRRLLARLATGIYAGHYQLVTGLLTWPADRSSSCALFLNSLAREGLQRPPPSSQHGLGSRSQMRTCDRRRRLVSHVLYGLPVGSCNNLVVVVANWRRSLSAFVSPCLLPCISPARRADTSLASSCANTQFTLTRNSLI